MLRIRRIRVSDAVTVAGDVLDDDLSPQAFAPRQAMPDNRTNAMWLGSEDALRPMGLTSGDEVTVEQLAAVLRTSQGAFDLRFWAPSSVSWVWATTDDAKLRTDLEYAMVTAANYLLAYLVETRPVVDNEKPAAGFAAALALHVRAWRVEGHEVPPPQLHAHCLLAGVVDDQGRARPANGDALFEETVTRELGAVGRAVLAEDLVKLGFQIESGTGYQRRYFEIDGVPKELLNPDAWRHAVCCEPAGRS
jgi:conjugative relaxase-like TrwC/TraI family protein